MADTEELIVKIEAEPEAPPTEVKVDDKPADTPAASDPGADLQAQLKEYEAREEQRKQELVEARRREEEQRRRAEAGARQSHAEIIEARLGHVSSGIAAAEAEANAAEQEYTAAMDGANYAAAAKAQRKMAQAEAQIARLAEAKDYWTVQKQSPPRQQPQPQPERQGWNANAAIDNLQGASREWARNHSEFFSSERQYMKVQAAHMDALADGLEPESAEYFSHVERRLGIGKADNGAGDRPAPPRRSAAPPAAPVNAGSTGNGIQGNVVTLTPGEARAAEDGQIVWNYDDPNGKFKKGQPIGRQEYARRKREMMRQGAYDRTYTES